MFVTKQIKKINGKQYLKPYKNNLKTLFFYSPEIEFNTKIPKFIEEAVMIVLLKGYLKYVKENSEKQIKKIAKN